MARSISNRASDAPDGLQSQWRDRRRRLAYGLAAGTRLDVGEREERLGRMGPVAASRMAPGLRPAS
jgi:hypothetical protein